MSATDLQHCDRWTDVNNLVQRNWIKLGTALGIHIKYSSVGTVWVNSHVDWLIEGLRRVVAPHGWNLHVLGVCNFTVRSPNVVVMVRVIAKEQNDGGGGGGGASAKHTSTTKTTNHTSNVPSSTNMDKQQLPLHWTEYNGWVSIYQRSRDPSSTSSMSSDKYLTMKPWLLSFLSPLVSSPSLAAATTATASILIHEPGFNHLLPELMLFPTTVDIWCCAATDKVQLQDLQARHCENVPRSTTVNVCPPFLNPQNPPMDVGVPNVALLLTCGGVRAWRDMWFEWCMDWIQNMDVSRGGGVYCLVIHVSQGHVDKLVSDIAQIVTTLNENENDASATLPRRTSRTFDTFAYHWQHSSFAIVPMFFSCSSVGTNAIDSCQLVWKKTLLDKKNENGKKNKKKNKTKKGKNLGKRARQPSGNQGGKESRKEKK